MAAEHIEAMAGQRPSDRIWRLAEQAIVDGDVATLDALLLRPRPDAANRWALASVRHEVVDLHLPPVPFAILSEHVVCGMRLIRIVRRFVPEHDDDPVRISAIDRRSVCGCRHTLVRVIDGLDGQQIGQSLLEGTTIAVGRIFPEPEINGMNEHGMEMTPYACRFRGGAVELRIVS
jgi:hypothetical protein